MINSVKQHHRTSHCHQQSITHLAPYYSPIISTPAFAPESPAPSEIAINYSPLPSRCFMVCSRLHLSCRVATSASSHGGKLC